MAKSLSEIARELKVSVAAVSYVYNGKWRENRIGESLAERIRQKLEVENVHPNFLGELLRTGHSKTVGVMLPDLTRDYNLDLLSGIERELALAGYFTLLCNSDNGEKEDEYIRALLTRGVDGLLLCPSGEGSLVSNRIQRDLPVVMIDNYLPEEDCNYVVSDNFWGARKAVEYCLAKGRRKVAYFGKGEGREVLRDRYRGYVEALKKSDGKLCPLPRHDTLPELIKQCQPDAIFAESFLYFAKEFRYLFNAGLRLPEDLLLTGFDSPASALAEASPMHSRIVSPIPYVSQQSSEMGATAARRMLEMLKNGGGKPCQRRLRPKLCFMDQ